MLLLQLGQWAGVPVEIDPRHAEIDISMAEACQLATPLPPLQPFYGHFSGTIRVSRCQKRTSRVYGARKD